jgi:hypothetical protein
MGKDNTSDLIPANSKYSQDIVQKLESIKKIGGTIEEACGYAEISRRTYHYWLEQHPDFAQKMESADHYADIAAKHVVVDDIVKNKDVQTAKWWLEKRQFKDGGQVTNINLNNLIKIE